MKLAAISVDSGLRYMPAGAPRGRKQNLGTENIAILGDDGRIFAYYAPLLVQLDLTLKL